MKKRLFNLIVSLVLILSCLTLVGCSGGSALLFNGATFNSTEIKDAPSGYKETLSYSVTAQKDYEGNYGLGSLNIDESIFKCSYSNGSYTSTLVAHGTADTIENEFVKNSEILKENEGKRIYSLVTKFSIDVTYSLKGGEQITNTDTIESEVYFCSASLSYAPIYSKTNSVNTLFSISQNNALASTRTLTNEVKYYLEEYTSKTTIGEQSKSATCDYEFQTVTDNAQLLFVMRNCEISEGGAFNLPVVAFSYDEPVTLTFRNNAENEEAFNIENYNGEAVTDAITVKNLSFLLANTATPGAYQYAVVQKTAGKNGKVINNALLTTYAHLLYSYGSVGYYNVLVYNLTDVDIYTPSV